MRFDVLTLFPDIFNDYLGQSLLKLAIDRNLVEIHLHNIRDQAEEKRQSVDDRPYGGGPGMVLKVDPVVRCVETVQQQTAAGHLIMLTPQGRRLDQRVIEQLANQHQRFLLLCGRYEGFDERIREILKPDEISIGDYILNGGEVAAMVMIDSLIRMVPGTLGDEQSSREDSFSQENRLLEYAQYTRPREFRGHQVPEVLLNGNHQEIAAWRKQQSLERTKIRRADLLTDQEDS